MPGKTGADEGSMGSGAMDQMETQGFEVSTQVVMNALPSQARTFAEEKTLELGDAKSPEAHASAPAHQETPSPRGIKPVEITPVKSYPTRDSQLMVKATKESDKKEAKEAKAGNAAGRGRGRGGRTRVRCKRGSEGTEKPKKAVKKVTKTGDVQWPNTFARRYRPNSDNWTQKLWEGCALAFAYYSGPSHGSSRRIVLRSAGQGTVLTKKSP